MKVVAHELGFYGKTRRRPGDVFDVPEGTKSRWFAPVGEKPEKHKLTSFAPRPAADPQVPASTGRPQLPAGDPPPPPKALEDMKVGELITYAQAHNLDIGGLVANVGKEKVLAAVKAALVSQSQLPAGDPPAAPEGRTSDQNLI